MGQVTQNGCIQMILDNFMNCFSGEGS